MRPPPISKCVCRRLGTLIPQDAQKWVILQAESEALGLNEATQVDMVGVGGRSGAFELEDWEKGKGGCVAASSGSSSWSGDCRTFMLRASLEQQSPLSFTPSLLLSVGNV